MNEVSGSDPSPIVEGIIEHPRTLYATEAVKTQTNGQETPSARELYASWTSSRALFLLNKPHLQGQLAQLWEESERYKSKIEEVMQEGRMKDVKIMQLEIRILEAEMISGERKPSNDLLTLVTDQNSPITALPNSLVQSGMKVCALI